MTAFDPTKPVRTRDGREARIICTDRKDERFPIVSLIKIGNDETINLHSADGKYHFNNPDCDLDLVNVPETHIFYRAVNARGEFDSFKSVPPEIKSSLWGSPVIGYLQLIFEKTDDVFNVVNIGFIPKPKK